MSDKKYTIKDWLEGRVGIEVSGEKEFRRLMDIAEENDILWSSGTKPHDFRFWNCGPFVVSCNRSSQGMSWREWMGTNDVRFADIVPNRGKKELHITSTGNMTHAVLKQDGKVVRRSMAACHPDDKYDFLTGARAALDRMQGKKPLSLEDVPTEKLVEELGKREGVKRKDIVNGGLCIGLMNDGRGYYGIQGLGPGTILIIGYEEGKSK